MSEMKQIMTTQEVATHLSLSDQEVRRLESEGVLRPLRGFRKPKKFSLVEVQRWLRGEMAERY